MRCPIDKTAMKTISVYGGMLDVCPKCEGVWFDAKEFSYAIRKFSEGTLDKSFDRWKEISIDSNYPKYFWQEDTILCPRDYSKMRKSDYAGDSGIHIDRCFKCGGFWIDGGEIAKLWEYLKPDMNRDLMGRYLVRLIREEDRKNNEMVEDVAMLIGAARTPQLFVLFLFYSILKMLKGLFNLHDHSNNRR